MPPFICLRSQVKDLADDYIKPAFRRTIVVIMIIIIIIIIITTTIRLHRAVIAGMVDETSS